PGLSPRRVSYRRRPRTHSSPTRRSSDLYIRTDKQKLESSLRDTVLISVRKSITLNPDSDYIANNKNLLVNLAAHYFNIAKTLLQDRKSTRLNSSHVQISYAAVGWKNKKQ